MKPKLLLLDIETAPATAYVWKLFDENIGLNQLITPGRIISWAAKWVGRKAVFYHDEREGRKFMLQRLAQLMLEADAVVTYNGDRFDLPKINGAMVEADLEPLPPVASVDLYKTIKKMGFQSGKLAFIAPYLKIGQKVSTGGFDLWRAVLAGDKAAWERMRKYNIHDVRLLQRLYMRLRPYVTNHPYLGGKRPACRICGSRRLESRGHRYTKEYQIERMHCLTCGAWPDGQRKKLLGARKT